MKPSKPVVGALHPHSAKLVTRAIERPVTVQLVFTKATYDKLAEASRRLHVPITTVIERMIERQEQAEIDPP